MRGRLRLGLRVLVIEGGWSLDSSSSSLPDSGCLPGLCAPSFAGATGCCRCWRDGQPWPSGLWVGLGAPEISPEPSAQLSLCALVAGTARPALAPFSWWPGPGAR